MNGGEVLITISINCFLIYFLHVLHKRSISNTLQLLRKEVNELENLVAAIIEEFEDIAERVWPNESDKPVKLSFDLQDAHKEESAPNSIEPLADFSKVTEEKALETMNQTESKSTETLRLKESESSETLSIFQPQEIIDPKHQRIMQLWRDGLAIEEIAKELGTGRGGVQLVLGIYKRS